ncbi:MAG: four helix bundle protein, partial [Ruminococcus sp.]|nr:four helix bundle protein [Ruminococcus sp.]
MKENPLIDASKKFAVEIFNLCSDIRKRKKGNILINQLLRSGTSIGANIHEANYASGRADFINKLQIALKECYETEYWLELLAETGYLTGEQYESIHQDVEELLRILTRIINTA